MLAAALASGLPFGNRGPLFGAPASTTPTNNLNELAGADFTCTTDPGEVPLIRRSHSYIDPSTNGTLQGWLIYQDLAGTPLRPGLLIFPGPYGDGGSEFERAVGCQYAKKGMSVFLPDYSVTGMDPATETGGWAALSFMGPFLNDTVHAQSIALLGLEQLLSLPFVNQAEVGVIGFCFGGAMALNLARAGASIKVAVALHAEYPAHYGINTGEWDTQYFLEMAGADDPFIPPAARDNWVAELKSHTATRATNTTIVPDWGLEILGNTHHSFSIPYPDSFYSVISQFFTMSYDGTFPYVKEEGGVPGIFQYNEVRSRQSFRRIDQLFSDYGLIQLTA